MLIQPNKAELGDTRLSLEEGLIKLKEDNQKLADTKKLPNQEFLENKEAAKGRPLEPREFLLTLEKMQPQLLFKPTKVWNRDSVAIYHFDGTELKYITGFFVDCPLPEWSYVNEKDAKGIATRVQRGWREVLIQLIKAKALIPAQAEKNLGKANGARATGSWDNYLQGRR